MKAREKDLLKLAGKTVVWKCIVITGNSSKYKSIETKCVGYALDCGYLIVDAAPTGRGFRADTLDPVSDVVVHPCERYLFVNPNNVCIL